MIYNYLHTWFWFDTLEAYAAFHFWKTLGIILVLGIVIGRP